MMKVKTVLAYIIVLIGSIITATEIVNACEIGETRKMDELMCKAAYGK